MLSSCPVANGWLTSIIEQCNCIHAGVWSLWGEVGGGIVQCDAGINALQFASASKMWKIAN